MTAARLFVLLALLTAGVVPEVARAQQVSVPDGDRMSDYRAPVPASAPGATTIDAATLHALIAEGDVVLIDVLPRPPRPAGLPDSTVWAPKPRQSLPGAVWIPNAGFGQLSDDMHGYYAGHLERLATEMPGARLVIFCEPNCWMSWNAVRRAAEWGYDNLYWFPEGTEGWKSAGFKLEPVEPEPPVE